MKKTVILILFLFAILFANNFTVLSEQTNLVESGDMEALDVGNPTPMMFWSNGGMLYNTQYAILDTQVGHNSSKSFYMSSKDSTKVAEVYQFIDMYSPFEKESTYTLSAWIKAEITQSWNDPKGGIYLFAEYKNGGQSSPKVDENYNLQNRITSSTNGWVNLVWDFVPTTKEADLLIVGVMNHTLGKVWIDDISLVKKVVAKSSSSSSSLKVSSKISASSISTPSRVSNSSSSTTVSLEPSSSISQEPVTSSIESVSNESISSSSESTSDSITNAASEPNEKGEKFNPLYIILPAAFVLLLLCGLAYFFILKK